MFRGEHPHSLSYEQQAKFIQERITSVEKNFGDLCVAFGDYTRKTARLRDKGDELAKVLREYANNELVNKSLSAGLEALCTTFTAVEEHRNALVQRLEAKVLGELCQYEGICKQAREEVKHSLSVREKELARKKVLDRTRERQPFNRHQMTYAEAELTKASAEMSRTARSLSEQTEFFERRKLQQLKGLLTDFVAMEMHFHARALELLTVAHTQIEHINDKADLENFRRKLRSPEKQIGVATAARSSSLASLLRPHSPYKPGDEFMTRRMSSPEKPSMVRANSLAALMSRSSSKDDDELETTTTESEGSEEGTSEESESR